MAHTVWYSENKELNGQNWAKLLFAADADIYVAKIFITVSQTYTKCT